jgi:hypothetical protein
MKKGPNFLSTHLSNNPGNPIEQTIDLRRRVEQLERLLISPDAADARYAQIDKTAFHVHKGGSDQGSVITATWTKVSWYTAVFDRGDEFNLTDDEFSPNEAGEYLLGATIKWTSFSDGATSQLCLYLNSAAAWYGPVFHSGAAAEVGASVNVLVQLAAGDVVELYARQASGFDRTIEGDATDTYFWGMRVQ